MNTVTPWNTTNYKLMFNFIYCVILSMFNFKEASQGGELNY